MRTYQLIIFILYVTACTSDDWTSSCLTNCTCKWSNGKKSVICNGLELTSIPSVLSTEIQVLYLNENKIVYLKREEFTLHGLANLQKIYLKKSNIRFVDKDAFKNLKILIEIDLSENHIETLDKNTFNGNDRLRILYLYGNPLRNLQYEQFPLLPHLRSLDLHNCQISNIDPTAFINLELLEFINLNNNLLENLHENIFKHMINLKTLILDGNPWRCNCKLRDFRNWYIKQKSILNSLSLLCKNPRPTRNKQWDIVDDNQFGCSPIIDLLSDDIYNVDIGSNITFSCLIYGDPLPDVVWEFNGKNYFADNENELNGMNSDVNGDDIDNYVINNINNVNSNNIINNNILLEKKPLTNDKLWYNLTIINITNYDAGIYVCSAKNNIGTANKNITIFLAEIVQHVIDKGPETFWYFGLILGTFGTVFGLITISFLVCLCKKSAAERHRRRTLKNLKGSVSFNDQEKKLLDLSITTNDRQDSCEIATSTTTAHTPSSCKNESTSSTSATTTTVLALEPVQITIENISTNQSNGIDEFDLNMGSLSNGGSGGGGSCGGDSGCIGVNGIACYPPPPPEFCTSTNPPYSNIFISVSLTQQQQQQHQQHPQQQHQLQQNDDNTSESDLNMYPDLLNIPNRGLSKLFPVNISSYATLPRNCGNTTNNILHQHHNQSQHQQLLSHHPQHHLQTQNQWTTLPHQQQQLINYQNLDTNYSHENYRNGTGAGGASGGGNRTISLCVGCLKNQDQKYSQSISSNTSTSLTLTNSLITNGNNTITTAINTSTSYGPDVQKMSSSTITPPSILKHDIGHTSYYSKFDNMGKRITASGNSSLSLPDEEQIENDYIKGCCTPESFLMHSSSSAAAAATAQTVIVTTPSSTATISNTTPKTTITSIINDYVSL